MDLTNSKICYQLAATNIKSLRNTKELARLSEHAHALSRQIHYRIVVHDINLAATDLRPDPYQIWLAFINCSKK